MASFIRDRVVVARLSMTVSGNRMGVDVAYGCDSDLDDDHVHNVADIVFDDFAPVLILALSQDVHLQSVYARGLKKEMANPRTRPFVTVAGLVAQDSIPSNLAIVIRQIQSDVPSRHNGRIFFPGVAITQQDKGIVAPAAIAGVWGDVADFLKSVRAKGGHNYTPVTISRFDGGAGITPIGYRVANTIVADAIATQRRRTTELREGHA